MKKVNLKDIQGNLVSRGRHAYTNPELQEAILALNPADETDGFVWEEAQGNPNDEDYSAHKAKYRNRVTTIADQLKVAVTAQWTIDGQLVVALAKKSKRK
jgi:hypothetical protein